MYDLTDVTIPSAPSFITAVTTTATSAAALGTVKGLYILKADGDVWYRLGTSAVTAPVISDTSSTGMCHFLKGGEEKLVYLQVEQLYIRVISTAAVGTTYLRAYYNKLC